MKIGDKLNKVKTGVGGVKTRSMLVVVIVIVLIAAVLVWTALRDTNGVLGGSSNVKRVKPMENLPGGGSENVIYNPLQEKENQAKAEAAKASGQSAVPSLLNQGAEGYGRGGFGNLGDNTGRCGDECYDQSGFDAQGFDRNGFDKNGFDRNGYDKDGFNKDGFDRQGYDRDGFNKQGCNRQGMNREGKPCAESNFDKDCFNALGKDKNGCDKEGKDAHGGVCYNAQGFNKEGLNKCGLDASGFDKNGKDCNGCGKDGKDAQGNVCYDATGFNKEGLDRFCHDRNGFGKDGFNKDGFDKDGFDRNGYDKNGFDRNGCNREGKNKEGKPCGYDKEGFDSHGFNKKGLDRQGYDKNGLNAEGRDRMGFDKEGCDKDGKNRQGKPCHGGEELPNVLGVGAGGDTGATAATSQAQANAQYDRLMADQRAMQAAQMAALTAQQQQELLAQQQAKINAKESLMSNQANALIAAWAPPTQAYVRGGKKDDKPVETAPGAKQPGALPEHGTGPLVQKAGDIVFAIIDTSINSDEPGPVLARIVSGPLKGSKVLGTFDRQDKKLMLTFTTLSMPDVPQSISIDAIAIDPETARTALASGVDNHYLTKYGSLIASSFLEGMGQAVETSIGTPQLSSQNSATVATTTAATTRDQVIVGFGKAGQRIATEIDKSNIQPTVTLEAGTGVGLLIMSDLRIEAPEKTNDKTAGSPNFGKTTSGQVATNLAPPPTTSVEVTQVGAAGVTSTTTTTTPTGNTTSSTSNTNSTGSTGNTGSNTGTANNQAAP